MTQAAPGDAPLLELRGIRKAFGDVVANDHVDLAVTAGQVHALLGENGAGKTTLMRIVYGLSRPDDGAILVDGTPVDITSPADAIHHGIGMVTQHFSLVRPMTVTDNILLSRAPLGRIDRAAGRRLVTEAARRLGVDVDPDAVVEDLSVGQQQRVEILKALSHDCRILILDEPTAVLTPQDIEALFTSIRRLTAAGMGVVFISHKLGEVMAVSNRVSVLRDGHIVDGIETAAASRTKLAEMMVGRPTLGVQRDDREPTGGPAQAKVKATATATAGTAEADDPHSAGTILTISGVTLHGPSRPVLDDVHLTVAPGEVVGVAGVSGNGQTELVEILSGVRHPDVGTISVTDVDITMATPGEVMAAGLGRLTEDRHASMVNRLSVAHNLVLEDLDDHRNGWLLDRRGIRRHAEQLIERFSIKARPGDTIGSLSGGNMQKVLLARMLARDPQALVVSQPTRGLDVGATEFVHTTLLERRRAGAGILLVSEDLEELLALSDRIVVMYDGRIVGRLSIAEANHQRLGLLMAGEQAAA